VLRGPVVYVSDGDTIGVRLNGVVTRVRLIGIDAPESKDPHAPIG
jgi:endonuclease YncB( thermonuclease family)